VTAVAVVATETGLIPTHPTDHPPPNRPPCANRSLPNPQPPTPTPSLRDTYPLVMLSSVGPSTLEFATASLEWMSDGVTRAFDMGRGNPFRLKWV
jgi:hypothetical protein